MNVRDRFKDTVIEWVPAEWEVLKTEELLQKRKGSLKIGPFGSQLKKEYLSNTGSYKVYGQENVFRNDFDIGARWLDAKMYEKLQSCALQEGDIVISMMGTIGKSAIVPAGIHPGIMDSHLIRLQVDRTRVDAQFFRYLVAESSIIQNQIKTLSVGGIMDGLSSGVIKELIFPVPPLPEQQKIAEILSTVDEHIGETEALIEHTKTLKQGMMQRLLTKGIGHTEFKETEIGRIPEEWDIVKLGSFAQRITHHNDGYDYPVLTISSLSGFIDQKERWSFEQAGESLKRYTVIRRGCFSYNKGNSKTYPCGCIFLLKDYEAALVPNVYISFETVKNDPDYLQYYFLSRKMDSYLKTVITSTARANGLLNIDTADFFSSPIAVPPLAEQEKIAGTLSAIDDQIDAYQCKLNSLTQLKSGLMQQLLTGRIRVKV